MLPRIPKIPALRTMCNLSPSSPKLGAVLPALSLTCACLLACQSYQPEPLDAPSHLAAWRDRTPADDQVSAFARQLATQSSKPAPFNPSDGLTLAEAELVALVFNPDLRLARLRAGVARATAEHAGRWDDPELEIDLLKVAESIPNPWLLSTSISLTVPLSGRLGVERSRAEASLQAGLASAAEAEWQAVRDLRAAWLTWSANHLRLLETEHIVTTLDSVTAAARGLAESGELLRTEADLFTLEQETRRAELAGLRGRLHEGEQEIRALMGISPQAPARLLPALTPHLDTSLQQPLDDANPTLVLLKTEYELAELTLQREIRRQVPDIGLGPQLENDQGQSRIGLVGGLPLPILNANKGGIATASAERELARAAFETGLERVEGRLAALRHRLEGARASRTAIEARVVPLVDRQLAEARSLLELGEGSSLVLLESISRAHQTKLDLIGARLDESITKNEIRHLLGLDRFPAFLP